MKSRMILTAVALLALSACASMRASQVNYANYAGEPVREIRFASLYNWQRTGDKTMMIWTRPNVAFLLTLRSDCYGLIGRDTVAIGGIDGITGRLEAGFSEVMVGPMHCRIVSIQPIDLERIKRDRRT